MPNRRSEVRLSDEAIEGIVVYLQLKHRIAETTHQTMYDAWVPHAADPAWNWVWQQILYWRSVRQWLQGQLSVYHEIREKRRASASKRNNDEARDAIRRGR